MRRLQNASEGKFWEAWVKDDVVFCYRYGKIGAAGHTKIKKFASRAAAEAELAEKLAEKLREGFTEEGAAPEASKPTPAPAPAPVAARAKAEQDEADEDEGDGEADEDEEDEADEDEDDEDEKNDADEADEDDQDEENDADEGEDEKEEDEEEEGDRPARVAPPPPPPPEPEKPKLPVRVRVGQRSAAQIAAASDALASLRASVGGRSWKVARWGRRARRALEPLSGIDPAKHPELAEPFDALMALAIAPKKRLPLHVALGILLELDAAVFVRTVRGWRSKMLASPAAAAIGVMAATVDAVIDTEVAIQAATAMVERRLSSEAWRRYFGKVRPFFEEELGKAGSTFAGYLASLRADDDMRLRERIAEAAR